VRTRSWWIIVIGVALAATAGAQTGPGGNFGGHLGWAKASDAEDGNFLVGAHLELRPLPWLGVQGSADYRLADEFGTGDTTLKIRSVPLTVTGRLYFLNTAQLSVFAAAGAGWYYLVYDYSETLEDLGLGDDHDSTFGWHLGGGVVLPLADKVSLYGEGRVVFVDPDQEVDDELADDVKDWNYDSTYLAAGVNFEF
jgi:opacity protein-like surface antigen